VIDPRGHSLVRHAAQTLRFTPGRDVALLNALLHTIIEEGLTDRQYIQAHTEDYERLREHIRDYSPEKMAPLCGIDAAADCRCRAYAARCPCPEDDALLGPGVGARDMPQGGGVDAAERRHLLRCSRGCARAPFVILGVA